MEMTSNWQSSIDLAADARLKNSRTWERARVFIYYIYIYATDAAVIYRTSQAILFFRDHTLLCACAAPSNDIKYFSFWTLTVHNHYATSTSLLDTERDDVISSQSYLCCITTILLIWRMVAKQQHSNASTPSTLSFCSYSCNLLFLVGVIDPISISVTESQNNLPMPL